MTKFSFPSSHKQPMEDSACHLLSFSALLVLDGDHDEMRVDHDDSDHRLQFCCLRSIVMMMMK